MKKRQYQIVIGTVLGDAYVQKTGSANARIRFEHSEKQYAYILWKYEQLKNYMQDSPKKIVRHNQIFQKTYTYYRCQSHSSPELGKVREIFYTNGRKTIPDEIDHFLDNPLTLAVWYMDDGYYYHRDKIASLYIHNDDKWPLVLEALHQQFGLTPLLKEKKKGKNLQFSAADTRKLITIIQPYIIPSMEYKIN